MCRGALARCRLAEHEAEREKKEVGGAKGWSKRQKDGEAKREEDRRRIRGESERGK